MERFIDPCCEKCFNSKENPCEQFVECCLEGPLCHESESCKKMREAIIEKYVHNPAYREQ
ncbi:MAG: CCxxC motif-containing NuoF prefix domain-containing protein [Bacillota bacterium]